MKDHSTHSSESVAILEKELRYISHLIKQKGREILSNYTITPPQFIALQWLHESGDMTIGDLSTKMYLAFSTTTDLVDRMEKNELVQRVRDENDRRVVRIHLLSEGERIIQEVILKRQDYLRDITEEFTEEEIKRDDLFNIFIEAFDNAVKKRFDNPNNDFEVYVLSLSDNSDSLTLWGNYAKGKGYSLSFNTKSVISEVDKISKGYMVYNKVIYKKDQQLETLSDALLKTFSILYKITDTENLKEELLAYFNSLIISYSIFFKHHSCNYRLNISYII